MSKNWCQGFCGLCGTGCGEYCDGAKQTEEYIAPYVDYDWPGLDTRYARD